MAMKGDHDGKSGRSDNQAGGVKQMNARGSDSRTAHKQQSGHGGHK